MELRHTSPEYYAEKTVKRYKRYFRDLERHDRERASEHIALSRSIQSLVTDLFTRYANREGTLTYSEALQPLNQVEMSSYRRQLESFKAEVSNPNTINQINVLLGVNSIDRLTSVLNISRTNLLQVAEDDFNALSDFLTGTYLNNFYNSLYEVHKGLGIGFPVDRISEEEVRETLLYPWSGATYQEYIFDSKERLHVELRKTLTSGLRDELQLAGILQLLDKKVDNSFKNLKLINDSELSHSLNESKQYATDKSNISESYILIATLDNRTSRICRNVDGKKYKYSEKKIGVNYPPFHYYCRTVTADFFSDSDLENLTRIARDPSTNQNYYVPANITYNNWFREYVR